MKNSAETKFGCEHCGRTFARESTVLTHVCEQKRRWDERDRPANRIAFDAWVQNQNRCFPSKKTNTQKEFQKSSFYTAFMKFGTYCTTAGVVNTGHYSTWLLKTGVPIDSWVSDRVYDQYLQEYIKLEDPMEAVKRSITTLLDMCEEQNIRIGDAFRLLSPNKLCYTITAGKISPWLLFNCLTGQTFLASLNEGQLELIIKYIDPNSWNPKFKRSATEVAEVKQLLASAGL